MGPTHGLQIFRPLAPYHIPNVIIPTLVFATGAKRKTKIIAFQLRSPISTFLHTTDHQTMPGTKRRTVQRCFKIKWIIANTFKPDKYFTNINTYLSMYTANFYSPATVSLLLKWAKVVEKYCNTIVDWNFSRYSAKIK